MEWNEVSVWITHKHIDMKYMIVPEMLNDISN